MEPRTACWMVPQTAPHLAHLDGGIDGRQHSSPAGVADGLTAGTLLGDARRRKTVCWTVPQIAPRSAHLMAASTAQLIVHPRAHLIGQLTARRSETQTAQQTARWTVQYRLSAL